MIKEVIGRIQCIRGRHTRSRGHARMEGGSYLSICRYCGVAMRQASNGQWAVEPRP